MPLGFGRMVCRRCLLKTLKVVELQSADFNVSAPGFGLVPKS